MRPGERGGGVRAWCIRCVEWERTGLRSSRQASRSARCAAQVALVAVSRLDAAHASASDWIVTVKDVSSLPYISQLASVRHAVYVPLLAARRETATPGAPQCRSLGPEWQHSAAVSVCGELAPLKPRASGVGFQGSTAVATSRVHFLVPLQHGDELLDPRRPCRRLLRRVDTEEDRVAVVRLQALEERGGAGVGSERRLRSGGTGARLWESYAASHRPSCFARSPRSCSLHTCFQHAGAPSRGLRRSGARGT